MNKLKRLDKKMARYIDQIDPIMIAGTIAIIALIIAIITLGRLPFYTI